jgi:hypothetical protein
VPTALCVNVNAWPAITIVPLRSAPVFAVKLNSTVPLPAPDPDDRTIHGTSLLADHAQPLVAVTATDAVPAAASAPSVRGEMSN